VGTRGTLVLVRRRRVRFAAASAAAASIAALALGAVPAFAGSTGSGQISFSGPAHGVYQLSSCTFGHSAGYGPVVVLYFATSTPKAGDPAQVQMSVQLYGKHGPAKANLAKTKAYFVQPSFFLGPIVEKYAAGASKALSGRFYHDGSGSLSISSNLAHGSVSAHALNLNKPHAQKLTVKASWRCS
jgi:hypothetical protein